MKFIQKIAMFCVVLVVFLELFFRFVMPVAEKPAYFMDPATKLVLFDAEFSSKGTYTWGRFPVDGGDWVLNNQGWLSVFDYKPVEEKVKPRVALLGDSFIAGLSTDKDTHLDVRLFESFNNSVDFYSFGMGGQYLEQYRVLMEYVDKKFDPDIYLVFVNSRDIKSSLTTYGKYYLYHQLEPNGGGFKDIAPNYFKESRLKRLLRRSSLVIYLRLNAGIQLFGGGRGIVDANANPDMASGDSDEELDPFLVQTADLILDRMVEGRPGKQFVFVGDGHRNLLYKGVSSPQLPEDCRIIQAACSSRPQCHYLDLMEFFIEDYSQHGRMFNFVDNYHWNVYGSDLVAEALAGFLKEKEMLPSS